MLIGLWVIGALAIFWMIRGILVALLTWIEDRFGTGKMIVGAILICCIFLMLLSATISKASCDSWWACPSAEVQED